VADDNLPASIDDADDNQLVARDSLGKFVKGVSGNPQGRPRGSRNRAALVREAIEEAVQRDLANVVPDLLDAAVELARNGDKSMLRLLLGDMLKPARQADPTAGKGAPRKVVLNITQNFGRKPEPPTIPPDAVDADFKLSSEDSENG